MPTDPAERAVVVTGAGVVSAFGVEIEAFWSRCLTGCTVVEPIPAAWRRYSELKSPYWSPLGEWRRATDLLTRAERKHVDGVTELCLETAERAIAATGRRLELDDPRRNRYRISGVEPERCGVFLGTGIGGIGSLLGAASFVQLDRQKRRLATIAAEIRGLQPGVAEEIGEVLEALPSPRVFDPFSLTMAMPNASAAQLAIKLGLCGPCRTYSCACASGTVALGQAFRALREGECDLAVAGGADLLSDPYGNVFRGFDALGALVAGELPAERANRPFDEQRSGFLFAEGGAALLVLEAVGGANPEPRARRPVRVVGYGESCDAASIVSIDPAGTQVRRAMTLALADAGWPAATVDYVNTHGTGTPANDPVEAAAIAELLPHRPAVNSTKSLLGHTLGASGALEAAVTVLSLRDGALHPSRNLDLPVADLAFVTERERRPLQRALSLSFAFGGQNAALAFETTNPIQESPR